MNKLYQDLEKEKEENKLYREKYGIEDLSNEKLD